MAMRLALKVCAEAAPHAATTARPATTIAMIRMRLALPAQSWAGPGDGRQRTVAADSARIEPAGAAAGGSAGADASPEVRDRLLVRGERQVARQRGEREEARRDGIVARPQSPAGRIGGVEDQHRAHARVVDPGVDAMEAGEPRANPGLLAQLAHRAAGRRLAILEEARGEAPRAGPRRELAPDHQQLARARQDHPGGGGGVPVVDEAAGGAGGARRAVVVPAHQSLAAANAESGAE